MLPSHDKDGLQRNCKECTSGAQFKSYNKNKKAYIERNNKREKTLRDKLNDWKTNQGCLKCKEKRFWVLDIHHIMKKDKKNHFIHKTLIAFGFNSKEFQKELQQCIVLYSNCHKDFHFLEKTKGETIENYLNKL